MINLIFQKFIKDTIKFFIIVCFTIGLIVWVMQAVNYLDFITEDGHGLYVYFTYTLLNFPKIIHRILPFVFFISIFYQLSKYERQNELLIFWTNGVKKIQFINVIIFYSLIFSLIQILLGSVISPEGQNKARSMIRSSNVDFFPSLIKEGKFIDTVSDLTIFIDSKNKNGVYKNIFLDEKDMRESSLEKSQTIYAKTGILISENKKRYFKLYDGRIIKSGADASTNFTFEEIDFDLSGFTSKTTTYQKIQEAPSLDLIMCIYYDYKKMIKQFKAEYLKCADDKIGEIQQEVLKRFYKPFYLPLIGLACCLLILTSKESLNYNKFRFFIFLFLFFIIIISEISLRYSAYNNIGLFSFIIIPIVLFFSIYILMLSKFRNKIKQ